MGKYKGTPGDDYHVGGANDDRIHGYDGFDTLAGGAGADLIDGGEGNDTLYSGAVSGGYQAPYFSEDYTAPTLDTGSDADQLIGGSGDDTIFAGAGDSVNGGEGTDTLLISFQGASAGITVDFNQTATSHGMSVDGVVIRNVETDAWVEGSQFDDTIIANNNYSDFAPIFGLDGNDHLVGGYYTGEMFGGDGNDMIEGYQGGYAFNEYGGTGNDQISGTGELFGEDGDDTLDGSQLNGGAGNDTLNISYNGPPSSVDGGADSDVINGGGGDDEANGGAGADFLYGNFGDDILHSDESRDPQTFATLHDTGTERDQLFGGDGNDILDMGYGDSADGGSGTDSLSLSLAGYGAAITLDAATLLHGHSVEFAGGTIKSVEQITYLGGTDFGDHLTAADQGAFATLDGGGGNDVLIARHSGVDMLGGEGNDRLVSGSGTDVIDGGDGIDTVDYGHAIGGIAVELSDFDQSSPSASDGDYLENIENVSGSAYGDVLRGNSQSNVLDGRAGDDHLIGGYGDDVLIGGPGMDVLSGGVGADRFVFRDADSGTGALADRIVDFSGAQGDTIDLHKLQAIAGASGDQAFDFIGTAAFDHIAGELRYEVVKGAAFVSGDTNGDGIADFTIRLDHVTTLAVTDFHL